MLKVFWRLLAKALGEKSGDSDKEADTIALIRFAIVSQAIITNIFIVANFFFSHWEKIRVMF